MTTTATDDTAPVILDDDGCQITCPDCGAEADSAASGGVAQWTGFPCGNGREYNMGVVTYTDECSAHWTDRVDVHALHEPTVRAIIDTMRRTGAGFAARVLEAQYDNGQVEPTEPNAEATRLRQLADFIVEHPDIPFHLPGSAGWSRIIVGCEDAADMRRMRRLIGGRWDKVIDSNYYNLNGQIGDNHVQLYVARNEVCERVVVGTETKLVPDPDAPKVEQEVEIVEWHCPDALLAGTDDKAEG